MNARAAAQHAKSRRVLVGRAIERNVVKAMTDAERCAQLARQRAVMAMCDRGPTDDERQRAIAVLAALPGSQQASLKLG